jgi:hypothetical protein
MSVAPPAPTMVLNEFMLHLMEELRSERKLSEASVVSYIKVLYSLNDKKPFKSLAFLRKSAPILEKIATYAPSTQKNILGSILGVLTLVKDKGAYKKTYEAYAGHLREKKAEPPEVADGEKSKRESDNWLSWEDVEKRRKELEDEVAAQKVAKTGLTPTQFQSRLNLMVLSLYTLIQPRRNQDYTLMRVVPSGSEGRAKEFNYLDLAAKKFCFNQYKTSKKYGQKCFDIPEPLMGAIDAYLKFHPLKPKKGAKDYDFPLLVDFRGTPFTAVNAMTRLLGRIFGRRVGSSLLRHIYLSSKYNLTEMAETADAMGHSLSTQRAYLRKDEPAGGAGESESDSDESEKTE